MVHNRTASIDWDDLRLVLAVGRAGSLRKAAAALGLGHATLSRRLGRLEAELGVRLMDRPHAGAAVLTAAGEALAASAAEMDDAASAALRRVAGQDLSLTGTLRLSINPLLGHYLLAGLVAEFAAAYPSLHVEMVADDVTADLDRREADVAVRVSPHPPETLVGQRIAPVGYGLYAARPLVEAAGSEEAYLADAPPLLGYTGRTDNPADTAWIANHVPGPRANITVRDALQMVALTRAGAGVALLPLLAGESEPELVRLMPDRTEHAYEIWLLTHADLRRAARVRAFMDHMADALRANRIRISGSPPA